MTNETTHLTQSLIRAFIYIAIIGLGLVSIFVIREILLMFYVAIILSLAFDAPIDWLQKIKIHRLLGTFFFYVLILSAFGLTFYLISDPLINQIRHLNENFPEMMRRLDQFLGIFQQWDIADLKKLFSNDLFANLSANLTKNTAKLFGSIMHLLGGLLSALFILVISIYLNAREKGVKKFLIGLVPMEHRVYALNLIGQIQKKMSNWLWGLVISCIILAVVVYITLSLLQVPYALTLGIMAGLFNILPYIGPVISAAITFLIALTVSPMTAFWVVILYVMANLILEDIIIKPLIMKKAVDIDPLLIMFAVLVGGKVAGMVGVILAIPTAAIIGIIIQEYNRQRSKELGTEVGLNE